MSTWEARRALVYGSERIGYYTTKASALRRARREIAENGNVGRVELIDEQQRIVYFDVHPEDA